METSHYARKANAPKVALRVSSAKTLLNVINKNFGTLPFCRRYLDRLGQEKYLFGVRSSPSSSHVSSVWMIHLWPFLSVVSVPSVLTVR